MEWHLIKRARSLLGSSRATNKAVGSLVSGQVVVQVALLISVPLLTRLYTPQQLGAATAMLAMAALITPLISGTFDQAVVLARSQAQAVQLAWLVILLSASLGLAFFLIWQAVLYAAPDVANSFEGSESLRWAPICALLTACTSSMVFFAAREKHFSSMAVSTISKGTVTAAGQLAVGAWSPSTSGLLIVTTVGQAAGAVGVFRGFAVATKRTMPRFRDLGPLAREYSRFPRLTLPATLLSAATLNALPLLVGALYGGAILGVWGLAQRLVALPLVLVAQSVGSVYYQRASAVRHDRAALMRLYDSVVVRVAVLSLPLFVLMALLAQPVVSTLLGPSWAEAGFYVKVMIPWIWIRLVASVVSQTPAVVGRNGMSIVAQSILLLTQVFAVLLGLALHWDFTIFLAVVSGSMAVAYAALLLLFRRTIRE